MPGSPKIEDFEQAAREFCAWVEAEPSDDDVMSAFRHLARLQYFGTHLRDMDWIENEDVDASRPTDREWQRVYKERFHQFPFDFFGVVFNPLVVPPESPVISSAADCLADIWRELKEGMDYWDRGRRDLAEWYWHWSFKHEWGGHAAELFYALHAHVREL